jgi:predicted metal-binding membrane protein
VIADPGSPARVANRAPNVVGVAVLAALIGAACWLTIVQARQMCCMLDGLVQIGRAMPLDMGPVAFGGMWTVMMAAMMLPGIVSVAAAQGEQRNPLAGVILACGYLATWVPTAVVAFSVLAVLNTVDHPQAWLHRAGGLVIALAGVYQFTSTKRRLLDNYRRHTQTASAAEAFGSGLSHGLRCMGASWALMSVLLVVGVMNIAWMAVIGSICLAEKTFDRRTAVATGVGAALVGIGLIIMISPRFLDVIALTA